jgi:hypothetical protein
MVPESRAPVRSKANPRLLCRLRYRQPKQGFRPPPRDALEIELENASDSAIEIPVDMHPLQYLDLIVTGPDGEVVSSFCYGSIFAPMMPATILRLRPGEKYVAPVGIGNVPPEKRRPGCYLVRAVYECGERRAESDPFPVCLPPQGPDQG